MKIIVIEDNVDILDIMTYILEEDGHEVISSINCSITEKFKQINPDLIILDELLPDGRGSLICKQVKSDASLRHIPVIMISTIPFLEKIAKQCGADAYLEKPFNINHLSSLVNSFTVSPC